MGRKKTDLLRQLRGSVLSVPLRKKQRRAQLIESKRRVCEKLRARAPSCEDAAAARLNLHKSELLTEQAINKYNKIK